VILEKHLRMTKLRQCDGFGMVGGAIGSNIRLREEDPNVRASCQSRTDRL
jgi:hypothetical protein